MGRKGVNKRKRASVKRAATKKNNAGQNVRKPVRQPEQVTERSKTS